MSTEGTQVEPGTALVHVQPEEDPRVLELFRRGVDLKEYAKTLLIETADDAKAAGDNLLLAKDVLKALEDLRLTFTRPLNAYVAAINEAFKGYVGPIKAADTEMRQKVGEYDAKLERQRAEQEEINRLRREASQRDQVLNDELSEPVNEIPVSEPPKHYRGLVSTTGMARTRKWEVEDLTKVPLEYLMIDSAKVGKVVRAGVPSIPGIRIWEDKSVVVRPRTEQVSRAPVAAIPVAHVVEAPVDAQAFPDPDLPF